MKIRKIALAIGVALMLTATPAAAFADGYEPDDPSDPTLAGSTAVGECIADAPWIFYSVELTDPDSQATGNTAILHMTDGTNSASFELGELVDGAVSGQLLWPGASVDENGVANGWPGWEFIDGEWVEVPDNFRWTRGDITATIEVNPETEVALAYPPATPQCAVDPPTSGSTAALPATGLEASMLPLAVTGGVLAIAGAIVLVLLRRRSRA